MADGFEVAMDEASFEAMEQEYEAMLSQMEGDDALSAFRGEYEKMAKALQKSHDSERRLMSKCRELNAELVANAAKVESAMHDSHDDEGTISSMEKELEQAWKLVDSARENESILKENIETLRDEISRLNVKVEEGAALPTTAGPDLKEMIAAKKQLQGERDTLTEQVVKLREEIAELTAAQQEADKVRQSNEAEIESLQEQATARKTEGDGEARKKANLERELKALKLEVGGQESKTKELQQQLSEAQENVSAQGEQLRAKKMDLDKLQADLETLRIASSKLQKELDKAKLGNKQSREEIGDLRRDYKSREEELQAARHENAQLQRLNEGVARKLKLAEDAKIELEGKRDQLKGEVKNMEREMEAARRQTESDKKQSDELARARDMLTKKMLSAGKETEMQEALVKMHESTTKHLETEIAGFKAEAAKQRKLIHHLETERDRHINETALTTNKCMQALEQVKLAEGQIFDNKKKFAEAEGRLKQQQSLYEQVRADRNLYSKNLIEAQDEITEMKRKLKIMNHQIDQLKEEITGKDNALVREHAQHEEVEQHKIRLKSELDRLKDDNSKHLKYIQSQQAEEEKLKRIVLEADQERQRQAKELEAVVNERDILGTQLIRRNDELALVYEKIRIQQSTLSKGEVQYRQRVDDIRLLKMEIKKLRREKGILNKTVANVEELKREVYRAQRELMRERMRCRALEEELETPMNIHRWRKLEGSDPNTYEMVQKVQTLQKRLISKTQEVVEKELLIKEKEKAYVQLKNVLARQPGPEVAEQLQVYQQSLKDKTRQMKAMASELNMFQAQSGEYKYEIERLSGELQDAKKKYFEQKRKEQVARERERTLKQATAADMGMGHSPHTRYTGGGFKLNKA